MYQPVYTLSIYPTYRVQFFSMQLNFSRLPMEVKMGKQMDTMMRGDWFTRIGHGSLA